MKSDNVIQIKSYAFALKIVELYRELVEKQKEYVISKQILKSGTSIGANVEEAIGGQTKRDFFAKMNIAYKECRETYYWLKLMRDTEYINKSEAESLMNDCDELQRITGTIIKTMKSTFN